MSSLGGKCSIIVERLKPVEAEENETLGAVGTPFNSSLQVQYVDVPMKTFKTLSIEVEIEMYFSSSSYKNMHLTFHKFLTTFKHDVRSAG